MNTLRTKAIVLSIVFSMCVLAMPLARVNADSFPSTFYVNNNTFYDAAAIFGAYTQLDANQKEIAAYLLGMYNLFYLGARGFQFQAGAYKNESEFIAKIKSFGYRIFTGSDGTALHSRFDDNFCKYASAVLLYASQCKNVSFSTWFENLDEDFVIPVDQGILNSFTLMYNDNSNAGVAMYGDVSSPWESGVINTFNFPYPVNTSGLNVINSFNAEYEYKFLGQAFVDGTSTRQYYCSGKVGQYYVNTLYVLRNDIAYSSFVYGYSDRVNNIYVANSANYIIPTNRFATYTNWTETEVDIKYNSTADSQLRLMTRGISSTSGSYNDLSEFVYECFRLTPFKNNIAVIQNSLYNSYPYVSHVFLVDNLSTLSNLEEVFNSDSWDIVGLDNMMFTPIDTVEFKPKVLTTINLPDNNSVPVNIQDMINDDNVIDQNGDPVNPWQITVVVPPNDTNPISIDVNLFTSGKVYLEYLWEHTKKIAMFAKDILDCFEFDAGNGETYGPKYAIYGVLVLGMAGGMIAKFLL